MDCGNLYNFVCEILFSVLFEFLFCCFFLISLFKTVLDISKHIPLYNSLLELLFCLASNESLRHLLMLPVYSDTTAVSSDGNCLSSLLAKLGTIAKTYQKTAG